MRSFGPHPLCWSGTAHCKFCPKMFTKKCILRRHTQQMHKIDDGLSFCSVCGKKISRKDNLKNHKKVKCQKREKFRLWTLWVRIQLGKNMKVSQEDQTYCLDEWLFRAVWHLNSCNLCIEKNKNYFVSICNLLILLWNWSVSHSQIMMTAIP